MNSIADIRKELKKFGSFIYTKDRLLDLALMEEEWRELHKWNMLEKDVFEKGLLILRAERSRVEQRKKE